MPGPYAFPVDRVTGGPAPATDFNALAAAFNEATPLATPNVLALRDANGRMQAANPAAAEDVATKGWVEGLPAPSMAFPQQVIPAVGSSFQSNFFTTTTTSTLRDRNTAPMPLLLDQEIQVDQATFNLTVLAATAGQTAKLELKELVPGTNSWALLSTLVASIPLTAAGGAAVAATSVSFAAVTLEPGRVYGFALSENQAYDSTLRVTQGLMTGPGIGPIGSSFAGYNLPTGANASLVTAVPMIKLRRSA